MTTDSHEAVARPAGEAGSAYETLEARYRRFYRQLNELWEGVEVVNSVFPLTAPLLKSNGPPAIRVRPFAQPNNPKTLSKGDAFGAMDRYQRRTLPTQTLVQAVSFFELLLAEVALLVHLDFPDRVYKPEEPVTDPRRYGRLLEIILESSDRAEILEFAARDRIRSIGFGNIVKILRDDAYGLGCKQHFMNDHDDWLVKLGEASARRNLWVHSDGKVDRHYLRLVPGSSLRRGHIATVTEEYLIEVLATLRVLGACATTAAVGRYYQRPARGRLAQAYARAHA